MFSGCPSVIASVRAYTRVRRLVFNLQRCFRIIRTSPLFTVVGLCYCVCHPETDELSYLLNIDNLRRMCIYQLYSLNINYHTELTKCVE